MTQTEMSPPADRIDPPFVADERPMLDAWLDFHRRTLLWKCEGLRDEQLKTRSVEPSSLSLLGLVRHMAEVERGWFRRFAGVDYTPIYDSDGDDEPDFDDVDTADVAADFATFRAEVDACRELVAGRDLDDVQTYSRGSSRTDISLRWVLTHMIEEYARHNGHADLLRERIDGAIGD
jgi:uncharacterized damage-inducible protein DinB